MVGGRIDPQRTGLRPDDEGIQFLAVARSWQVLDMMHHRPAALAIVDFLGQFDDGKGATDAQGRDGAGVKCGLADISNGRRDG